MSEEKICNIIKEIDNGNIFIGGYLDIKSILDKIDRKKSIFLPKYEYFKIYKPYDDYIIEPYIIVQ